MRIFKKTTKIDFMGERKLAVILSASMMLIALVSIAVRGLNMGIDFTGGTLVEVEYAQPVELPTVRAALAQGDFGDATVQHFGTSRDVLVRLAPRGDLNSADLSNRAFAAMSEAVDAGVELRRVEFVGPQVGEELTEDGGLAMLR